MNPKPTLVHRIKEHASRNPDKIAIRLLDRSLKQENSITYGDLAKKIETFSLRLRNLTPGSPIVLFTDLDLDFVVAFFGVMDANHIPVVSHAPRYFYWKRAHNRLASMIRSCGANIVFTNISEETYKSVLDSSISESIDVFQIGNLEPVSAKATNHHTRELRLFHSNNPVALLQYTSGSLGAPKGVVVTHSNLNHNLEQICTRTGQTVDCEMFTWLPHSHDMGLVGGLMVPLHVGGTCTVLSQLDFLRDPLNWWRGMTQWKSTITAAPSFAYELCLKRFKDSKSESDKNFDLSKLATAFIGAERIRPGLLRELGEISDRTQLQQQSLYPAYGLAECTLMCSGPIIRRDKHRIEILQGREYVSCGEPIDGIEVVVDGDQRITIDGASVSPGYWDQPHLTLRNGLFNTGDYGFTREGELYPLARSDSSFSINGQKHYAEDFEDSIRALTLGKDLKFAISHLQKDDRTIVVALVELKQDMNAEKDELRKILKRGILTEHLISIEVEFVPKGSIEYTTSGKPRRAEIQRLAESLIP